MCRLVLLFPSVLLQVKEKKQTVNKKNVWSLFLQMAGNRHLVSGNGICLQSSHLWVQRGLN